MNTLVRKNVPVAIALMLMGSAVFLVKTPQAHAEPVEVTSDSSVTGIQTMIKSTVSAVSDVTTAASTFAQKINDYVLQPIAFVTSGNLIKSLTAGVLKFIGGETNGTGQPQFVQNLLGHMQGVGDTQARTFFDQFSTLSNSPFAPAITSSLKRNYLQNTSLAGFFAKNQCTLDNVSSDIVAYAQGDWSKGGWSAWFSLTTQTQNNPFTLYQDTQSQLSATVADATAARLSELNWGQGFLSWCGSDSTVAAQNASDGDTSTGESSSVVGSYTYDSSVGNAPGDACTNADGSPGTIKNPGSFIKDKLVQITGLEGLKLTGMGNVGPEINTIIRDIGAVMNTINLGTALLGSGADGLAGLGGSSSISDYQARAAYLGVTENSVVNNSLTATTWQEAAKNVDDFTAAWTSIRASADTATAALTEVVSACGAGNNFLKPNFAHIAAGYATAAQNAQTNIVNPVYVQAEQASSTTAADYALIAKIKAEQASTAAGAGGSYGADVQALQAAPPSIDDVIAAQMQATRSIQNNVTASPPGSLNVSGGTIFDRMTLITTNANAMKTECDTAKQYNTYTP